MDVTRIHNAIEQSKRQLAKACRERKDSVAQFVGTHYAENGASKTVPTNMLEMAVTIYLRLLAAHEPRCVVSTEDFTLKPFAADMELVLNQLPREIGLLSTLRRAVMEAMFSIGVVKVGIAETNPNPKIGDEPFVSLVQLDDYFVDMSARSWEEVQYEGNEYWMTVEDVKKTYGADVSPDEYNGSSVAGEEQANAVSVTETMLPLYEKVLLRDVYLTRTNEMVTYAVNAQEELRRVKWDGPEGTPYVKLWFEAVPGNIMPLAPISVWKDLHVLGNQLYRKLANQAVARKSVAVFLGGSDDDISRFKHAQDGEAIRGNIKTDSVSVGGVDSQNLAFFLSNWDRFSMICGNLDSLGGLSAQSATAKQDQLISEAASTRIKDMGDRTVEFAREIFRRLAWYTWTDPVRRRTFSRVYSREFGLSVRKEWTPETRDGDFLDYNFDIAVFSMQDNSPATRVQKLMEVMNGFILPQMQMMMQQGYYIDTPALVDYIARNANLPDIKDIVKQQGATPAPGESARLPQPAYVSTKSPVTHRTYERVSRGGGTRQGRDAALMQTLLGAGADPGQMAQLAGGAR